MAYKQKKWTAFFDGKPPIDLLAFCRCETCKSPYVFENTANIEWGTDGLVDYPGIIAYTFEMYCDCDTGFLGTYPQLSMHFDFDNYAIKVYETQWDEGCNGNVIQKKRRLHVFIDSEKTQRERGMWTWADLGAKLANFLTLPLGMEEHLTVYWPFSPASAPRRDLIEKR